MYKAILHEYEVLGSKCYQSILELLLRFRPKPSKIEVRWGPSKYFLIATKFYTVPLCHIWHLFRTIPIWYSKFWSYFRKSTIIAFSAKIVKMEVRWGTSRYFLIVTKFCTVPLRPNYQLFRTITNWISKFHFFHSTLAYRLVFSGLWHVQVRFFRVMVRTV